MPRTITFETPESVDAAYTRITVLKQEISAIGVQLAEPKTSSEEPGWRKRALSALVYRKQEKDFLNDWVRQNKKTPQISKILDLGSHLRTHSKIAGRLGNLFKAAEDHIAADSEESFEALAQELARVRELIEDEE